MNITLNGQQITVENDLTIEALLNDQGYADMMVAVARNQEFVSKTKRTETKLNDGDDIEVVSPMQGG